MTLAVLGQNRWFRRFVWAAASLLGLWALAWLAVPPLVKSQAIKAASEQLGRQVTIGTVDFSPWTLELTVNDLAVAGQGAGPPQLAIKRIYMDAELQSLLRLAPVVDALDVDGVSARLRHLGGGKYDIDDILARIASLPPPDPGAKPARFALYNLSLSGGSLDFTDDAVGKTQEVRELKLGLPFLSNLSTHRQVKVEPRLALKLNGSKFDSVAAGTPFAESRKTDATLKLTAFDLRPWLGYIPASVPVRVQTAVLDADLRLAFEQSPRLAVKLSGLIKASGVSMTDVQGQPLLAFDALGLDLQDVRPLERALALESVELTGPRLNVSRDATGRLNLAGLQAPAPRAAAAGEAKTAAMGDVAASSAAGAKPPAPAPWTFSLGRASVRGGTVTWSDATTAPQVALVLRDLAVDATGLTLPFAQPMPFSGAAALDGRQPAKLAFSGAATDLAASASLTLSALPLSAAAPYLAQQLNPALSGDLTGEFGLLWKAAGSTGKPQDLQVAINRLVLDRLALDDSKTSPVGGKSPLPKGRASLASIQKVELTQGLVDAGRQSVSIGKLAVTQPQIRLERGVDGRWMYESWIKAAPGGGPAPVHVVQPAQGATPSWAVTLGEFALAGGNVEFHDKGGARPVSVEISALQVQARNFSPDARAPSPLSVSARIRSGQTEPGKLEFKGAAGMAPLVAQGQLDAVDIPLHAFEPYFGDALNIELLRADASFKGRVRYAQMPGGPALKVTGDTSLDDFRANSVQLQGGQGGPAAPGLQAAEELLNWRALSLRGLDVTVTPGAATLVDVKETTLSDFFARIIINETGRINLQDVVKASVPAGTSSTMAATASATVTAAPAASSSGPPPVISFGPVNLVGGKVLFSDRFVKPNYSANLTELNGKLSAFSSVSPQGTPQLADLELRGRAEGTASLEVLGKLNPLAKPLALDIKGKVRDLELPPLSPYSIKYAGHGIERGKLSLDVAYLVRPDGQLTASNRLVLNQLNFGEPVPGAPASLPVKLAVALLADRNGMIDLDLPISGSLNDPQFSLAPVILKIIINIIGKALTAPFSLLAGAFGGGGDELNVVGFSPGTAVLEPDAQKGLDKVAKALLDRPALKMTVVGTASLEVERDAVKRERLKQLVAGEKRREAVRAGTTATAVVTVSAAEYPALLKEAYRRADIKKPRNAIGMAKDIPQAEMEELLLANMAVTDESMRELAVQRGVAVRDYLASQKLPLERLYLGAAKSVPPEAKWSPRAEMNLGAN